MPPTNLGFTRRFILIIDPGCTHPPQPKLWKTPRTPQHTTQATTLEGMNSQYQNSARRDKRGHGTPRHNIGNDVDLIRRAENLDGRPYGYYGDLRGEWNYGDFTLHIDRIQADPYAPPSNLRVTTKPATMGLPEELLENGDQRLAAADFLLREFTEAISANPNLRILQPGPEILQRSTVTITPDRVELRFQAHLPARGRTILGRQAAELLDVDIPDAVMDTLDFVSEQGQQRIPEITRHIHTYLDYRALQQALADNNWVAFVANNSVLPRRSGISQEPLTAALPFTAPESLSVTVDLPHAGTITGMALSPGITVIAGGGYHGKSTLLNALQRGVYAHIPGDGRELVATTPTAMKVRAADGRAITAVNLSAFITHLPGGADTTRFSTENASGSTSQAAAIIEAAEAGATTLLIDEDTSATNLLIRDSRMRELVAADKEPITPLVDNIRALYADHGVSTILVMGGSGDYLDVADTVLMLDEYRTVDVTERAHAITADQPRQRTDKGTFGQITPRVPVRRRKPERSKTKVSAPGMIQLDKTSLDLGDVEQVVEPGQWEAIAWLTRGLLEEIANARVPLKELLGTLERRINSETLDTVVKFGSAAYPANLTRPRMVDVAAAVNRYRALVID